MTMQKKIRRYRYAIGIDLGTSNSALSYVACDNEEAGSQILRITQWETEERHGEKEVLPSYAFFPPTAQSTDVVSQWENRYVVGLLARQRAAAVPQRVIHSAKSWLSHKGIDRESKLLPWQSMELSDAEKLSPVEASALYLSYLRAVWDQQMASEDPANRFDLQLIVITVPASFDQDAQKLTLEAARLAGYPSHVRLLEEPQAAFYAWMERHPQPRALRETIQSPQKERYHILVCDIGGGTTDFSLFAITFENSAAPSIERIAVSDHILLGGDNMDFAIAKILEPQIVADQDQLSLPLWQQLVNRSRILKEQVLEPDMDSGQELRVTISEMGTSLFTQAKTASITRQNILELITEGFFPYCGQTDRPQSGQSGLREIGLPYAKDTAVTRHLADFCTQRPQIDAVLFNGGTLTPVFLQQRLQQQLTQWQQGHEPVILDNPEPYLSVARGAARFACDLALNRHTVITAGASHSFYIELNVDTKKEITYLVCILPMGTMVEELQQITKLDLHLLVNQPIEFRVYSSVRRPDDHAGQIVRFNEHDFKELPPLQTIARLDSNSVVLKAETVPVRLEAYLNALGLLQVFLVSDTKNIQPVKRWELEFNLRATPVVSEEKPEKQEKEKDNEPSVLPDDIKETVFLKLQSTFDLGILKELESIIGMRRDRWDQLWLRQFWEPVYTSITRRHVSPEYEAAWCAAAGYFLRPGYGVALDDYRIDQLWNVHTLELSFPSIKSVREQWFIMWRRVSGGLSQEQQITLYKENDELMHSKVKQANETLRMASSFERLPVDMKIELWKLLLEGVQQKPPKHRLAYLWSIGRLLSRIPVYAGADAIMPPEYVEQTFALMQAWDWTIKEHEYLPTLFAIASRKTKHRFVEISSDSRKQILEKMRNSGAHEQLIRQVSQYVPVKRDDLKSILGESLPSGLALKQF